MEVTYCHGGLQNELGPLPHLTMAHSKAVPTKMATKADGTRVESLGNHKETAKANTWATNCTTVLHRFLAA